MDKRELRVKPIVNGTVIDHITAGQALNVLKILGINQHSKYVVSVLMNVPSGEMKAKDVVKVEGRELDPEEVDTIALIAPKSTINIIRN
jgi:aspartate carbamoyltransferase regulatory subunit